MVEYFYGETLRWGFGFDNPNKAAVLFACVMPVFWWGWVGSEGRGLWKVVMRLGAGLGFLGAGFCLAMTFSRGGLVAACVGIGYVAVLVAVSRGRGFLRRRERFLDLLLLGLFFGCVVWVGLGERAGEALGGDASVGNRLQVWKSGVQMAADNPRGFGRGESGRSYMEWYQALEADEGYRTLVNSYLTFLVERGWVVFSVVMGLAVWFWVMVGGVKGIGGVGIGLRGGLVAFGMAGFFSTTMEDGRLWVLPGLFCGVLVVLWILERPVIRRGAVVGYLGVMAAGLLVLWCYGVRLGSKAVVGRGYKGGELVWIGAKGGVEEGVGFVVDQEVMGELPGRLLRRMVEERGAKVVLGEDAFMQERLVLAGSGVVELGRESGANEVVLIAPEVFDWEEREERGRLEVVLPELDEDGRVSYWEEVGEREGFEVMMLEGVGLRVDWAWEEVMAVLSDG